MVGHLHQGVSSHGDRLLTVTGAERDPMARLAGEAGSPSDSVLDPRSGDQREPCACPRSMLSMSDTAPLSVLIPLHVVAQSS